MFQTHLMSALCICVCVADGFDVLVNRALLTTSYNAPTEVVYRYVEGDRVDVTCLNTRVFFDSFLGLFFTVKLTYHYWEERIDDFGKFNNAMKELDAAVGLRTTLRAAHHRTRLTCEYNGIYSQNKIDVTFVLDQTADDVLYMKINGYVFREQTLTNSLTVFYTNEEKMRFDCGSDRSDVICDVKRKWNDPPTTSIEISPTYEENITYKARHSSGEVLRTVNVTFKPLPDVLTGYLSVSMDPSDDHVLMHLYHSGGRQLLYYQFDPGLSLSMTCTLTQPELVTRDHHTLMFGDTGSSGEVSITKQLILSASDTSRTEDCRILHQKHNSIVSLIRVLFYMTHGDANSNSFPYWLLGVAGLAAWVIAAVAAGHLRRRHLRDQRQARLAAPVVRAPDNVYCEVQPVLRTAAPLPTAQESSPDLNYADLDMARPAQHTRYHTEASPYAGVSHPTVAGTVGQ